MANTRKAFYDKWRAELQKKLEKKNIHEVPMIEKIVVSMGIGSLATRKGVKDFAELETNMATITGQAPQMIMSKKSVSNFKLREWMPVMLRTTLRREKAFDLIERLVTYVFPRIRDFEGLNEKKFDGRGNYTLGLKDQAVFPEINPEEIKMNSGLQITIVTSADTDEDAKGLLEQVWIIFEKKVS